MARLQDLSVFDLENRTYTVAEWQAIERRTGERFEYHRGHLLSVRLMAGDSPTHARIGGNVIGSFFKAMLPDESRTECGVYTSDLQVYVPELGRYLYPDATIVCGEPIRDARVSTAVTNPVVVIEVASPSSVAYDSGVKFDYYSSLPSVRDYVIVSQDDHIVEVRSRREAGGPWTFAFAKTRSAEVAIPSVDVLLPLTEVYRGVTFEGGDLEDEGAVVA